jgi:acyl-CoA thioester hydrolase
MSIQKLLPPTRADFVAFEEVHSRWNDNDVYGHINNVVYYAFFDTAVNRYLIEHYVLDIVNDQTIGLVVETQCQYFSSIVYPDLIHVGLKVIHLGNSSVKYEVAVFKNDEDVACALGNFVHVYVDRSSNKPTGIPQNVREVLQQLLKVRCN